MPSITSNTEKKSKKRDSLTLTPQVRTEGIEGFAGETNTWRANVREEDNRRI